MKNNQPRPIRHWSIKYELEGMKIGDFMHFPYSLSEHGSVKSIVSRLRKQYNFRRRFRTSRTEAGTRVERLP